MPRTRSAGLEAHAQQEVTTFTTCFRLVRVDGTEFHFTDLDIDVPFGGDVYKSAIGYDRTAMENDVSLGVDNMNITGLIDNDVLKKTELNAGLFDYADVYMFTVNYEDLTQGAMKLRRGKLGEMKFVRDELFQTEIRSMSQMLSQRIGRIFEPECDADVGDDRCKIPISPPLHALSTAYALGDHIRVDTAAGPLYDQYENRIYECTTAGTTTDPRPTYDTVVGNTTTDGTAVFTAREAWTRHATLNVVTDLRNMTLSGLVESRAVDGWFDLGVIEFDEGDNAGLRVEIKDWVQTGDDLELMFNPAFLPLTTQAVHLYPGCDRRHATCIAKFNNILNYRGFPFVPGQDFMGRYPDAV